MTLENHIIELRPHHVEVFLRKTRKSIEREVTFDYSPELAAKVLEMYDAAVSGRKIRIVPCIDDICKECRKICPNKEDIYCSVPDVSAKGEGMINANAIAEQLNLREGSEYSFDELQAREREYQRLARDKFEEIQARKREFQRALWDKFFSKNAKYKNWKVKPVRGYE